MSDDVRKARRSWSEDFKRRVVAEAMEPGVSGAAVARRYDLNVPENRGGQGQSECSEFFRGNHTGDL